MLFEIEILPKVTTILKQGNPKGPSKITFYRDWLTIDTVQRDNSHRDECPGVPDQLHHTFMWRSWYIFTVDLKILMKFIASVIDFPLRTKKVLKVAL